MTTTAITKNDVRKQITACSTVDPYVETIFIVRIRLQYPNNLICQTPMCAKSLFTIIHNKLQTVSEISVPFQNELSIQLNLCSIDNLICPFLSMNNISIQDYNV